MELDQRPCVLELRVARDVLGKDAYRWTLTSSSERLRQLAEDPLRRAVYVRSVEGSETCGGVTLEKGDGGGLGGVTLSELPEK